MFADIKETPVQLLNICNLLFEPNWELALTIGVSRISNEWSKYRKKKRRWFLWRFLLNRVRAKRLKSADVFLTKFYAAIFDVLFGFFLTFFGIFLTFSRLLLTFFVLFLTFFGFGQDLHLDLKVLAKTCIYTDKCKKWHDHSSESVLILTYR